MASNHGGRTTPVASTVSCLEDSAETWDRLVQSAATCDPFQTRAWLAAEQDCHGYHVSTVISSEGNQSIAGQAVISKPFPAGLMGHEAIGGPVLAAGVPASACGTVLDDFSSSFRGFFTSVRPTAPHDLDAKLQGDGYRSSSLHTVVVDLRPTEEELWESISGNARTGVRKGKKASVEVGESDDWDTWSAFHYLQAAHAAAHDIDGLTQDQCRYYCDQLQPAGACKLFTAYVDGDVGAAMLFILGKATMRYFIGCSRPEALRSSPNDLLMWEAIRWAQREGIEWLDLYDTDPRPDSPLAGIHKFKSKWGGHELDRPYYIRGRLYHWLRELKRKSAGRHPILRALGIAGG